jgi:hypothetical protein
MYHSRAAALMTGDHRDRLQDFGVSQLVGFGTPFTVAVTYTVGANIIARLEHTFLRLDIGGAVGTVSVEVLVNRSGVARQVNRLDNQAVVQNKPQEHDLLLEAGDTVAVALTNAGAVDSFIIGHAFVREIDL